MNETTFNTIEIKESRYSPLSPSLPQVLRGNRASDYGHLSNINTQEASFIRNTDPIAAHYLRPMLGQKQLLTNQERWCLWLEDASQDEIEGSPEIRARIEAVRTARQSSRSHQMRELAKLPLRYERKVQPDEDYLALPLQPMERYEYIPVDIVRAEFITNRTIGVIDSNRRLAMGVLSSYAFKVWNRKISAAGITLANTSADIAYNAFPLPDLNQQQKDAIEEGARGISTARAYLGVGNLDKMYDPAFKEPQLRDAHTELNQHIYEVFGLASHPGEEKIMERLIELYRELSH